MIPLLVAVGAFLAAETLEAAVEGFLSDTVKASGILGRTVAAKESGLMRNVTAEAFDGLVEASSHHNTAMSADGLMDIFERFMVAVAQASLYLSPEIAEELYTELIQEGFSNAIQMSVGGAFQSILNVWRGGYPLNPEDVEELARTLDKVDIDLFALLMAQAGCNIPSTAWRIAKGFDVYVQEKHSDLKAQADTALQRLNSILATPYEIADNVLSNEIIETLSLIRECYIKAGNLVEYVGERALSRLNELRAECQTILDWIAWQEEHPETTIISADEAYLVAVENKAEADATKSSYDSIKSKIDNQLTNIDVDVSGLLSEADNLLSKVAGHYNSIISNSVLDMTNEINKITQALDKLAAYRNAVDTSTSLKRSAKEVIPDYATVSISVSGGE